MKRSSGVLMHISSLDGDYSIGSFGDNAKRFIDRINEAGFAYWQVLPFGLIDECNSPYKSYSAFAGNPYFIDLPTLFEQGLITAEELDNAKQRTPYLCEFDRLNSERLELLFNASKRVNEEKKAEIEEYIYGNKYLFNFCKFMSLKQANGGLPWTQWQVDYYDKDIFAIY